jgi:hypothetical protein
VSVVWIAVGAAIAAWASARVWSWYYAPETNTLGTVSEQWLAEHRVNRPDSQR